MAVDRPNCYWCCINGRGMPDMQVSAVDAVFESLCGHEDCPTLTFHGLCLMEFRDSAYIQEARNLNNQRIAFWRHVRERWGDSGEG